MSRKKTPVFIPIKANRPLSIDEYINSYFNTTDKRNAEEEHFFQQWYGFLQSEREKRLEEITDVLSQAADDSVNETLARIVDAKYGAHPLCTVGSVQGGGGRFNIGGGMGHYKPFHCLYLASDDDTAYSEYFHYQRGYSIATLNSEELALKGKKKNYSNFEVEVSLENCIDIRNKEALRRFCEIISEIRPPKQMTDFAREIGLFRLKTVQTAGELHRTFMDREFLKFFTILDMPANPQWFGYYCYQAGIQCIIYPSVRGRGSNYAILVDNFRESQSTAKLNTDAPYIEKTNREINKSTFEFFKISAMTRIEA